MPPVKLPSVCAVSFHRPLGGALSVALTISTSKVIDGQPRYETWNEPELRFLAAASKYPYDTEISFDERLDTLRDAALRARTHLDMWHDLLAFHDAQTARDKAMWTALHQLGKQESAEYKDLTNRLRQTDVGERLDSATTTLYKALPVLGRFLMDAVSRDLPEAERLHNDLASLLRTNGEAATADRALASSAAFHLSTLKHGYYNILQKSTVVAKSLYMTGFDYDRRGNRLSSKALLEAKSKLADAANKLLNKHVDNFGVGPMSYEEVVQQLCPGYSPKRPALTGAAIEDLLGHGGTKDPEELPVLTKTGGLKTRTGEAGDAYVFVTRSDGSVGIAFAKEPTFNDYARWTYRDHQCLAWLDELTELRRPLDEYRPLFNLDPGPGENQLRATAVNEAASKLSLLSDLMHQKLDSAQVDMDKRVIGAGLRLKERQALVTKIDRHMEAFRGFVLSRFGPSLKSWHASSASRLGNNFDEVSPKAGLGTAELTHFGALLSSGQRRNEQAAYMVNHSLGNLTRGVKQALLRQLGSELRPDNKDTVEEPTNANLPRDADVWLRELNKSYPPSSTTADAPLDEGDMQKSVLFNTSVRSKGKKKQKSKRSKPKGQQRTQDTGTEAGGSGGTASQLIKTFGSSRSWTDIAQDGIEAISPEDLSMLEGQWVIVANRRSSKPGSSGSGQGYQGSYHTYMGPTFRQLAERLESGATGKKKQSDRQSELDFLDALTKCDGPKFVDAPPPPGPPRLYSDVTRAGRDGVAGISLQDTRPDDGDDDRASDQLDPALLEWADQMLDQPSGIVGTDKIKEVLRNAGLKEDVAARFLKGLDLNDAEVPAARNESEHDRLDQSEASEVDQASDAGVESGKSNLRQPSWDDHSVDYGKSTDNNDNNDDNASNPPPTGRVRAPTM